MNEQFHPMSDGSNYNPYMNQGMMFDPVTGQPMNQGNMGKKPKKTGFIIAGSVVAVSVLAVILISVAIFSGAFMSKKAKLARAIANTRGDIPQILKDMDASEIIMTKEYTVGIQADIEGEELEAEWRNNGTEKQLSATMYSSMAGDMDFIIDLDEEKVSAYIPMLSSDIIQYNYREKKKGYIVEMVGRDYLDDIDAVIKLFAQDQTKLTSDMISIITEEFDSLEIRNAEKAELEVGGEMRNCSGYEFTLTVDDLLDIFDKLEGAYAEYYGDSADVFELDLEDLFDEIRHDLRSMGDMEVKVYVYKNKLAAVIVEIDDKEVQLLFKGGDNRLADVEVLYDDGDSLYTVMEWTMETKGSREKFRLYSNQDEESISMEYDLESGNYSMEYGEGHRSRIYMRGNLEKDRTGIVMTVDELEVYGSEFDIELEMTIRKGAQIKELEGNVFDIGSASKSELFKFVMGMEGLF